MARFLLVLIILGTANIVKGQDFERLYQKLNTFKSFAEFDSVDKDILVACDYVLSQPLMREKQPAEYLYALRSMVKWMNNTERYRILIFGRVIDATHGDR